MWNSVSEKRFQYLLCLGEEKPKAAPGGKLLLFREVELHLLAGVPVCHGDHDDDNTGADDGDDDNDELLNTLCSRGSGSSLCS